MKANIPEFRVIIAGSRSFFDYHLLCAHADRMLSQVSMTHEIVIVSGGARGADRLGETYAKDKGYRVVIYPAKWDVYGKRAGYVRNEQMAKNADALIAFWDGESMGTRHMIDLAAKYGLKVSVKRFK